MALPGDRSARIARAVRHVAAALALTVALAGPVGAEDHPGSVTFLKAEPVSTGMAAGVCLSFGQRLDQAGANNYARFVTISPAAKPAFSVADNRLCLDGLSYGTTYAITVHAGLKDARGRTLPRDASRTVTLGDQAPMVALGGNGFVLPRQDSTGVPVTTVNLSDVTIHVLRVSDKLLPRLLSSGDDGGISPDASSISPYALGSLLQRSGSVAWSGRMSVSGRTNQQTDTAFPLQALIPRGRDGLYLVVAENPATALPAKFWSEGTSAFSDDYTPPDTIPIRWAIATNIAITSIGGEDGMHVLLRALDSGEPLAGASVSVIATGLDTLSRQKTGADGMVVVPPGLLRGQGPNAPAAIVAYGPDGDFAFQNLGRPAFDLSDRGVSGRAPPGPFQAFLFSDRGIYRPGETIHAETLLRDRTGEAVSGQKVTLLLRRPDGVVAARFMPGADAAGGFAQPVVLTASAPLGLWSLEAYLDPASPPIGRLQVDVQDFVPQQLAVSLSTKQTALLPGGQVQVTIDGRFLYGAPAAGLHADGDIRIAVDPSPVPAAKGYRFGLITDRFKETDENAKGVPDADAQGRAVLTQTLPAIAPTSLPLQAIVTAGLHEPGGRFVSDTLHLPIRNQARLIGLKPLFDGGAVAIGQPVRYAVRVFDAAGAPAGASSVAWRLVREHEAFNWYKPDGETAWQWRFETVDDDVSSGTLAVTPGAPATLPLAMPGGDDAWGTYRVIVSDAASGAATSDRFDVGFGGGVRSADSPDRMKVAADRSLLLPGQTTTVHLQGPFAGKATVLIAGDRVFSTREVDVPATGATFQVDADAAWGAGAYVLVSMVRPLGPGGAPHGHAHDPVRAVGVAWLGIDPAPHRLAVSIDAPTELRPRRALPVTLRLGTVPAGDHAFVSLAGVDEGILQLTRYATPDPLGFLFGKERLGVDMRDDYGRLLIDAAAAGRLREGGDASLSSPGLPVTSTKIVSLYRGPVQVAPDGTATVTLDVPDFEGQLRLTAVAWSEHAVGAASADVIVRDPVFADLGLPRFLAPGDQADIAVSTANTGGAAGSYRLALGASGPVSFTGGQSQEFTLAAGQRAQGTAQLTATGIGVATLSADLTGPGDYRLHREWQIAVRGAHPPTSTVSMAELGPGGSLTLDRAALAGLVPGTVQVAVGLTNTPGISVPALLGSLWTYPFGCTEQLSSTGFPLLHYDTADGALPPGAADPAAVHARVQTAIDTILDRQSADGSVGLWRLGDREASPWLQIYAVDFLARARAAGFDVPDGALARGYGQVRRIANAFDAANGESAFGALFSRSANESIAYAEYVLARAGRADPGVLGRLDASLQAPGGTGVRFVAWTPDGGDHAAPADPLALGQLSGALALMGQTGPARAAMAAALVNTQLADVPDWWHDDLYYSRERDIAGLIAIAAEVKDMRTVTSLLPDVARFTVEPDLLTTQQKSWLLQAAHALDTGATAEVSVNGGPARTLPLPASLAPGDAALGTGWVLANRGSGSVWRSVTLTGMPVAAPPALSAGYALDVAYRSVDGKKLDVASLRQNDRLVVEISGNATDDLRHRTIIDAPLPAGWEIESVVRDPATFPFLGPLSATSVEQARDDRFVASVDLGDDWPWLARDSDSDNDDSDDKTAKTLDSDAFAVAYVVRVVTPGRFVLPETIVQDMYRPTDVARTASSTTQATPR